MKREDVIKKIEHDKIMVVTRGILGEDMLKLAHALYKGGLSIFEITYDPSDKNTLQTIKENVQLLKKEFGDKLTIAVGTVINKKQVINAKEAGADIIVSPNFSKSVVKETLKQGMVSIPGCMTPTEICDADEAGADFIKFFPAGSLGIKYCKDIMAPLHHVKYLATVGITEETFDEFLKIGFIGAGISSRLVDKKLREEGNYDELTNRAKRFVEIASKYN